MNDIPDIKAQADIVSVISEYVELKNHGSRYYGLCPFHDETAGSFIVFTDDQRFHCFGCGESGDVLDFLQKYHGISLNEACKLLKPDFKQNRRRQKPTALRFHKSLCQTMDVWKAIYFDNLSPARRQKILDYCIDNWQPWQRPEYFKLIYYMKWKRRMEKHPALKKAWKKNVAEYMMIEKTLRYF